MNDSAAILALILGLLSVIAVTVWWPNPLDREAPQTYEEPLTSELVRGSSVSQPTRRGDRI
ncbi:hypothetical protein [Nocardia rhizosphaerihabitans]|uniref:hypothetical protein n=1 Tax=Nocardia rhizosphaerihabitans TaxID=1691570 RepID=UPI00166ECC90|nr:hypothetical protein [Nocardia rhizosphaerihabitans]